MHPAARSAVALVSLLVCDPTSPLYNRHFHVNVREIAQRARSVLAAHRPWAALHLSTEPDDLVRALVLLGPRRGSRQRIDLAFALRKLPGAYGVPDVETTDEG
jgi:hypothetical protein